MYGRRRGGGRGYRNNNPIGMGGAVASRSSPDGAVRGGFYNLGNRNFNRGFGRGQGRYFQSSQPLRRRDLFMEAGRLAAEYLVAKGMLPPNVLMPKIQNGGLRKEIEEFHEFREQDGEYMQLGSRTSALARLGSFEGGSDRKQYPNDYGAAGSKLYLRGRRDTGSFNNYDSDRGQENGKSGSISGRSRASSDKEADDDALSVHCDEQLTNKDDDQNPKNVNVASKRSGSRNSPSKAVAVADTQQLENNSFSKAKDCEQLSNMEGGKDSDGSGNINVEDGEMKESKNGEITGQHSPIENSVIQPNQVAATPCQKGNELLQLCNFAKVPTRSRSLRLKGSKSNLCTTAEEDTNSVETSADVVVAKSFDSNVIDRSLVDTPMEQTPLIEEHASIGTPVDPELTLDEDVAGLSESNDVVDKNLEHDLTTSKITSMDNFGQSFEKAIMFDHDGSKEGSKCFESLSFPDSSFDYSEESSRGPGSVDEFVARERGEKRGLDECDLGGTFKKHKAFPPSMISQVDEYPHLSNLRTEGSTVIERTSPTNNLMMTGQESSSSISGFTTLGDGNSIRYAEEKDMIDSSFKICDLNLTEGSHLDENHDGSQIVFFPSISETKKESLSVDGGLTICDNSNMSHTYRTLVSRDQLEVIDLEDDFPDDGAFNTGEKREDAFYSGLESFQSQPRSTIAGTNVQDGYGLMISELLGNEIPNCSTVPGDINSLHNDMAFHNGQGMLPEDDPIYMTLGEIPIGMPGFWEPANPEFGKPF